MDRFNHRKFYSGVGVGQTESLRHHGDIPVWAGDMKDKAMHPRTRKRRKRGVAAIRQNSAFDEYSWKSISPSAKQLISSLLAVDPCRRPTAQEGGERQNRREKGHRHEIMEEQLNTHSLKLGATWSSWYEVSRVAGVVITFAIDHNFYNCATATTSSPPPTAAASHAQLSRPPSFHPVPPLIHRRRRRSSCPPLEQNPLHQKVDPRKRFFYASGNAARLFPHPTGCLQWWSQNLHRHRPRLMIFSA
ncbi:hypothetical protein NE237_031080 [Protea cynaroides]|uniref:Uncharacterized protein n=1 Tax=Protea cynaroides TaxID=273540 RepID=A0A9Q0L0F2_9MAGN|nr:hypothetical protein NE237_031080 [Protea cynaroides]